MMKQRTFFLFAALSISLLAGCVGTPVVYNSGCDCPQSGSVEDSAVLDPIPDGAVRTGLALIGNVADSENATAAAYDITMVGVTVDDKGVIQSCMIDSIDTKVTFDHTGTITSDLNANVFTKNELGENYGMKAYGGANYEWNEQAAALARYAVGKTVDELKNGAVDESGKAPEGSDLASTATIYLGGYVSAIEMAAANAQYLGAQAGDKLHLASISTIDSSKSAAPEEDGIAQLDCDVTVLTTSESTITSCIIDSIQAKVSFDRNGTITTDLSAPVQTKNELGENYGMKAWGGAKYEWNEQAAFFSEYVSGKNAEEVAGIAVNERTIPTDTDLSSSVTIAIGGFQNLIIKAMQG